MDNDDPPLTRELNVLEALSLRPDRYVFFCTPVDEAITAGQLLHLPIRGEASEAFTVLEAMPLDTRDDAQAVVIACREAGQHKTIDAAQLEGTTVTISTDVDSRGDPMSEPLVPVSQDEKLDHYFVDMKLRGVPRRIADPWIGRLIRGFHGNAPPLLMMRWAGAVFWLSAVFVLGLAILLTILRLTASLLYTGSSNTVALGVATLITLLSGPLAATAWRIKGKRMGLGLWSAYQGLGSLADRNTEPEEPDDWY